MTVGLSDGTRVRTGWLAGCDGARSTVREAAGIDFPGVLVVEQFLLADVHAEWDTDRTTSAGFFHREGRRSSASTGGSPRTTGAAGSSWPVTRRTSTARSGPLSTEVLCTTTANTRILVGEGAVARFVRDRIFVPLLNSPRVQRRATRTASQVWVSYRRGPLGGRGGSPRPGDRIPDRACARADGSPTRLHAELFPAWVILAHPDSALFDTSAPRSPLLVRPDGHLAWRGADPDRKRRWFTDVLHTKMDA